MTGSTHLQVHSIYKIYVTFTYEMWIKEILMYNDVKTWGQMEQGSLSQRLIKRLISLSLSQQIFT
jgi:hypothetical protein